MGMEVNELIKEEKELAKNLEALGDALLSPSSSAEQILPLLSELEECLMGVNQSPLNCVQRAMNPAMKALTSQQLLYHLDVNVKVSVASCISEIMRITAPDAPYGDEQMKEIFKLIVAAFDNISDISSCHYRRRIRILETFTRIRLWVVMVDLECNSSVLQMFKHFLGNIREDHPEAVYMYMGFTMIMVLDEIDEIPPELLSPILDSVRKGNQNVLPVAQKLGLRVIENSILKLVPYMHQAVQYTGFPLEDYGGIVAYICDQMPFEHRHYEALASSDDSMEKCVKKSCNQGMHWSGRRKRQRGKINDKNNLIAQLSAKTSLAPDADEHLTGSRIEVACSGEQKREDTSEKKFDDKDPNYDGHNSSYVENETEKDVGNLDINRATESKNEADSGILKESNADDKKLKDEFLNPITIAESEDEKEGISSLQIELSLEHLVPTNFKKSRTPRKEDHGKSNW